VSGGTGDHFRRRPRRACRGAGGAAFVPVLAAGARRRRARDPRGASASVVRAVAVSSHRRSWSPSPRLRWERWWSRAGKAGAWGT